MSKNANNIKGVKNVCDTCPDYRHVPNQRIFARPFLMRQLPNIYLGKPISTSMAATNTEPFINYETAHENHLRWYYSQYTTSRTPTGRPISSAPDTNNITNTTNKITKYDGNSWLYGTKVNIDHDSHLKNLDYINPRDCIGMKMYNALLASAPKALSPHNIERCDPSLSTPKRYNNSTSLSGHIYSPEAAHS